MTSLELLCLIAIVAPLAAFALWPIVRVEWMLWRGARERRKRDAESAALGFDRDWSLTDHASRKIHMTDDGILVDDKGEPWA